MKNKHKERYLQRLSNRSDLRALNDDELKRIQQIYLNMASDIFKMCDDYGIYATLSGGSALGAVRHQGFIPWDDDMDINMPRKDYELFKRQFNEYFQGKYQLYAPNSSLSSHYRIGKIESTDVMIEDDKGYWHGLIIDLFVIENTPDFGPYRWLCGIRSILYTFVAACCSLRESRKQYIKNHKATPPYSLSERVFLLIGYIFSFRSADSWNDLTDRINQCPNEQSKYVSIPSGRRHYFGETYRRESMLKAQNMKFEDRFFPVPSGYDEYFSKLYGDYMTIPPVEKREKHYVHSVAFK